ncbi:MAG: hypothetical protein U0821_18775 [Chloroflexota bacterium]
MPDDERDFLERYLGPLLLCGLLAVVAVFGIAGALTVGRWLLGRP